MAIGAAGRTFCSELNRLANGGTYPAMTDMKDSTGAANAWAGTTGRGLIAALNIKASALRQPSAFKDLNGVCNELASTTDKSAVDALRSLSS